MCRSRHISHWDPEDLTAWEAGNKIIARRNLICSVMTVHLGYSVWSLWSVMALFMPEGVYGFSAGDKLLLGTTATLVVACLRILYALDTAIFGGRDWTIFSAFVLLIPTVGTMVLLAHPGLPLWPYVVCAALTGMGGGNFAASMSSTNAFYPHRLKGRALELTRWDRQSRGGGDPDGRAAGHRHRRQPAAVLGVRGVPGAAGDHRHRSDAVHEQPRADGESAAQASLHAAELSFIGPLLAAVARIYGGRLANRVGGSRVTMAVFTAMALATGLVIAMSILDDHHTGHASAAMVGYILGFIALFILSGLGNGSVYKMIPTLFEARSRSLDLDDAGHRSPQVISGVAIGFVAGFGSLGGVGINLALRESYLSTGSGTWAFWIFMAYYAAAAILTRAAYMRQPIPT